MLEIPNRGGVDVSELKSELKGELKTLRIVLDLITENPNITIPVMMERSGKSRTTIQKYIRILKEGRCIQREGGRNGGHWVVL